MGGFGAIHIGHGNAEERYKNAQTRQKPDGFSEKGHAHGEPEARYEKRKGVGAAELGCSKNLTPQPIGKRSPKETDRKQNQKKLR